MQSTIGTKPSELDVWLAWLRSGLVWTLVLGVPLSALGYALYPLAPHDGFSPVLLVVPYPVLGISPLEHGVNWAAFVLVQFVYYFVLISCARLLRRAIKRSRLQ